MIEKVFFLIFKCGLEFDDFLLFDGREFVVKEFVVCFCIFFRERERVCWKLVMKN